MSCLFARCDPSWQACFVLKLQPGKPQACHTTPMLWMADLCFLIVDITLALKLQSGSSHMCHFTPMSCTSERCCLRLLAVFARYVQSAWSHLCQTTSILCLAARCDLRLPPVWYVQPSIPQILIIWPHLSLDTPCLGLGPLLRTDATTGPIVFFVLLRAFADAERAPEGPAVAAVDSSRSCDMRVGGRKVHSIL
eukprot:CAMPEP_0182481708 /NCGR_PEP_ID=MMETSP1319-20130603/37772_1 /TAXON_ID=172717 /ORGANISM="Bolidomonas pacifica, Strain RCC208" /LENGTH=193 /DNA_ID=CAMNT_0024683339 /DNA_START=101 /DNA_END=682 /DNA_ORIENTATION=+